MSVEKQMETLLSFYSRPISKEAIVLECLIVYLGNRFSTLDKKPNIEDIRFECHEIIPNQVLLTKIICLDLRLCYRFLHRSVIAFLGSRNGRKTPKLDPKKLTCQHDECRMDAEEWDHIFPHSWGGPNEDWNFQALCKLHNRMKSSSLSSFTNKLHGDETYKIEFKNWATKTLGCF